MKNFPAFKTVQQAANAGCFKCGAKLPGEHKDSGYPPKRGQYVMQCGACRLFTFFDLRAA